MKIKDATSSASYCFRCGRHVKPHKCESCEGTGKVKKGIMERVKNFVEEIKDADYHHDTQRLRKAESKLYELLEELLLDRKVDNVNRICALDWIEHAQDKLRAGINDDDVSTSLRKAKICINNNHPRSYE